MKKMYPINTKHKTVAVAIFLSDKVECKIRRITRGKGHVL